MGLSRQEVAISAKVCFAFHRGSKDRVRSGNSLPELLYGGSLWFGWKGLDFNLSFQGIGHQNAYWSWGSQPYLYTAYACPKILLDSHWSYDNDDATNATVKYPKITTNTSNVYAASTFWLFNGAYARIKNITLGYTIPQNITKKISLSKVPLPTEPYLRHRALHCNRCTFPCRPGGAMRA